MDREYTSDGIPQKLADRLETEGGHGVLRRRAVLTNGNGQWQLVCCAVQGFLPGELVPKPCETRRYRQAILWEDFLSPSESLQLAKDIQQGHARFGEFEVQRNQSRGWSTELLPVNNDCMVRAGHVFAAQFRAEGGRMQIRTLLAPDQPYYPDVDNAARDWLPFPVYHGHSDGRNEQILYLLPETRAFFVAASRSEKNALDITVAGDEVDSLSLLVKGAYWDGKIIHHLDAPIKASKARLFVASDADRLEYYLIDSDGTVFDFHREDRFSRLVSDSTRLGEINRTLADQVRDASECGEGVNIEFKPFIAPDQKLGTTSEKTKLREVITSVVAFANTEGGHVYLGIEDDCAITGINHGLHKWAKAAGESSAIHDSVISRYLGALKNRIKEVIHGEVSLRIAHAVVGELIVAVIEVPVAEGKPVSIHDDQYFYVRKGATNRKLPPDQWRSVLEPRKTIDFG